MLTGRRITARGPSRAGAPAGLSAAVPTPGGAAPAPGADSTALRAAADSGRIQGPPGAKVWLIMVSDFQCPYCKQWHDSSMANLKRDYIDAGKIRLAYLHLPLSIHRHARAQAEASGRMPLEDNGAAAPSTPTSPSSFVSTSTSTSRLFSK